MNAKDETESGDKVEFWLRMGMVVTGAVVVLFVAVWRFDYAVGEFTRTIGLVGFAVMFAMFTGAWYLRLGRLRAEQTDERDSTPAERELAEALIETGPEGAERFDELVEERDDVRQVADDLIEEYAIGAREPSPRIREVGPETTTVAEELEKTDA